MVLFLPRSLQTRMIETRSLKRQFINQEPLLLLVTMMMRAILMIEDTIRNKEKAPFITCIQRMSEPMWMCKVQYFYIRAFVLNRINQICDDIQTVQNT